MACFGDPFTMESFHYPWWKDSMTAICNLATPDGFVIAADGLVRQDDPAKTVLCDHAQKIISIPTPCGALACSFASYVMLSPKDSDELTFDFRVETAAAAKEISKTKSLHSYANRLGKLLKARLESARREEKIGPYPTKNPLVALYLVGYFNDEACHVQIKIETEDQKVRPARVFPIELNQPVDRQIHGPKPVYDAMFENNDERFRQYRTEIEDFGTAIHAAEKYILAFCDPAALELDERCRGIGGRVHIATVTALNGFQWAAGFEPNPILF
ncbi:MAG TPA: hypothetical protein VKU19_16510 [Bryobacteraceae bacterium]|nr:hypothetical protein [Bryobacteraceae bacterium]